MAEYKLSYTAAEIDQKIGKVGQLSTDVSGLQTDTASMRESIKTIDAKIIPSDWNQTDETALDFIKNKPIEETEDDAMEMLFDMGIIAPAVDDGAILTDENGNILVI